MKFHSPNTLLAGLLALLASVSLVSCGGGGAQGNPNVTGAVTIQPGAGTVYAGVPFTFTIQGGRTPYVLTSSEPSLMPVPGSIDGHSFTVVAANPGVIDTGLDAGALPVRSVTITARSGDGITTSTSGIKVGQNFLTGYGITFAPLTCPITPPPATVQLCAGGESAVQMSATFNGNLAGDRQFQFQVLKGHFQFVFPQTGVLGSTVTTVSDHSGNVTVVLQANAGIGTEIGVLRVIDVASGVYDDHAFVISGVGGTGTLTRDPGSGDLHGQPHHGLRRGHRERRGLRRPAAVLRVRLRPADPPRQHDLRHEPRTLHVLGQYERAPVPDRHDRRLPTPPARAAPLTSRPRRAPGPRRRLPRSRSPRLPSPSAAGKRALYRSWAAAAPSRPCRAART